MSAQCVNCLAGGGIPEPHGLVITRRRQRLAVRRKYHGVDWRFMSSQRVDRLAGGGVPEPHGLVITRGRQRLAVRRKHHGKDRLSLSCQCDPLAGGTLPRAARSCRRLADASDLPSGENTTEIIDPCVRPKCKSACRWYGLPRRRQRACRKITSIGSAARSAAMPSSEAGVASRSSERQALSARPTPSGAGVRHSSTAEDQGCRPLSPANAFRPVSVTEVPCRSSDCRLVSPASSFKPASVTCVP